MSDKALHEKVVYFQQQDLLHLPDDEKDFPDPSFLAAKHLLADSKSMPPPPSARCGSSFLGPTPRERQQEFEEHATRQRTNTRKCTEHDRSLVRSLTAPEPATESLPAPQTRSRGLQQAKKLKKTASTSDLSRHDVPFYRRVGDTPRELKNSNAKPAFAIRVEPEHKQLLKEKIVYFFPNNDTSMARRLRIHKIIELGAAWVTTWRDDVTHVMFDDRHRTYSQLLRHLKRASLPCKVIVVRFDPYIPQCIQSGTLLDHTSGRFVVQASSSANETYTANLSGSQNSLPIKPSKQELATTSSQESGPTTTKHIPGQQQLDSSDEIVKDSFIHSPGSPRTIDLTRAAATLPDTMSDALSVAIREAKAVAHLPIDDDEEGDSRFESSAEQSGTDLDTDDEPETKPKHTKRTRNVTGRSSKRTGIDLNAFQCMNPAKASSNSSCPNARTIEILDQMCRYYDQMQDQWRTLAYRKAITTLRKQTVKISTAKEAATLPFVGSRLASKIEEIVLTDRLRRLDSTQDDPTDKVLRLFLGVYGAGLVQANKWIQAGYRTLDDLMANAKLTDSQKIGVKHYDDLSSRIPRAEVKAHGDYVRDALRKIDPGFETTIMGSYRRGANDSGDIDIIITKPGATASILRDVVFQSLVPQLLKAGFIKAKLAASSSTDDGSKWHGVSCLRSSRTWRRLDLLLVPEEEMGAALLYFTGNDIFNRSMRLLASKKGMRLNQRGLYRDVIRGRNGLEINEGTLVEGRDEKRIFDILGVPWREPAERIC